MLPPELWLRIFELVTDWNPHFVDIDDLRNNADRRNTDLLAFAVVCKAWSPLALHVLYREISMPGWDYHDQQGRYCCQTLAPLLSLIRTLSVLTRRKSDLPRAVQVLHVAIGRYQSPPSVYDYCEHCDFESVARAVQLCPRLRHLSLRVHCEANGLTWSIPSDVLRSLAHATHIEQITYSDQQDDMVLARMRALIAMRAAKGGSFTTPPMNPSLRPMFQLLSVLPNVRYLELETSDADGSGGTVVSPPHLTELRVRTKGRQFPSVATIHDLCHQWKSPSLRSAPGDPDPRISWRKVPFSGAPGASLSALERCEDGLEREERWVYLLVNIAEFTISLIIAMASNKMRVGKRWY